MPAIVVVSAPRRDGAAGHGRRSTRSSTRPLATGQMRRADQRRRQRRRSESPRVGIPLAGAGTDADLEPRARPAARPRDPATIGRVPGVTARRHRADSELARLQRLDEVARPVVFAFVLALAFLLLLVTFRSMVIPLNAIVLNLLSVGAAYGVLVLVFQDGRLQSLLGFQSVGGDHLLAAAVPVRGPVRPLDGLPRLHPQPRSARPTTRA